MNNDEFLAALATFIKTGGVSEFGKQLLRESGYRVTDREAYPLTIHKLPVTVHGHSVRAWIATKNRDGCYPGGYVLAHDPREVQPYVVWEVCTRDGGETWDVSRSGQYHFSYRYALEDFVKRVNGSDIATTSPDLAL